MRHEKHEEANRKELLKVWRGLLKVWTSKRLESDWAVNRVRGERERSWRWALKIAKKLRIKFWSIKTQKPDWDFVEILNLLPRRLSKVAGDAAAVSSLLVPFEVWTFEVQEQFRSIFFQLIPWSKAHVSWQSLNQKRDKNFRSYDYLQDYMLFTIQEEASFSSSLIEDLMKRLVTRSNRSLKSKTFYFYLNLI